MKKRTGFTLFELLTVLALLGLLFALLLPAVQKVREAASRTQSANNLKHYGLACHIYHDTYQSFPPGVDSNGFSALAHLLPFIEQNNLFQQIDFNKPITDKANAAAAEVTIKICLNPQDPVQLRGRRLEGQQDIVGDRGASWMDGRFLQGTFTGHPEYRRRAAGR
jgi:prepilin-type N-terminal cleavage/methylation domain